MSHLASLPEIQPTTSAFWRTNVVGPRTVVGTFLDVLFGVVAPIFCFAADPGVMYTGDIAMGLPSFFPLFVLAVAALSIVALPLLLVFGGRWGAFDAVLAGIVLAGGAVAFFVGLGLLPVSLMLLIALIGALGLLPLATSFVCLRNAARTLASPPARKHRGLAVTVALAVLLLAAGYQVGADRALDAMVADIARTGTPESLARLERWRPLVPRREMQRRAFALALAGRDHALSAQYRVAYERVTGVDLWAFSAD